MTPDQKAVCRELLRECYDNGFNSRYPLEPIAKKLGITEVLYDNNTNTGILWDLGPHGNGFLTFGYEKDPATHAGVCMDTLDLCEHWSDFRR